ncbi:hypothetical protein SDC9_134324 [bioreactor metagenome]|uniref:Uncharacterized protein n=1 Tax=bioreactor metagenome TaxID=1076179 RepID=A0A645DDB4_9ZZZZ
MQFINLLKVANRLVNLTFFHVDQPLYRQTICIRLISRVSGKDLFRFICILTCLAKIAYLQVKRCQGGQGIA